jgi:uncharacterized protein (DUF427 family)
MEQTVQAAAKPIKIPGPDHPISIERNSGRVVVSVAGRVIADTRSALTLCGAHYPAVQYIPRKDVDMTLLARTDRITYCPCKGMPRTSASPWAASARSMRCGPTRHPMWLLPTSRTTSLSIPIASTELRFARDHRIICGPIRSCVKIPQASAEKLSFAASGYDAHLYGKSLWSPTRASSVALGDLI